MTVIRLAATIRDDENALLSGVVGTPLKTGTTTSAGTADTSGADGLVAITSTIAEAVDLRLFNDPVYWTWNATDEVQLKTLQTWNGDADEYTASFVRAEDAASVEVAEFHGNRATPADGDEAYISFKLSDSAGNQDEGARITWKATTVLTGATQDTDLILSALVNNTLTTFLTLDGSASQLVPAVGINAAGVTSPDLGTVTTVDINGGTIDGTAIGGATPAAGAFTTVGATGLITATGGQIAFPATQEASAGANTLDDYEEGTFTPVGALTTPGTSSNGSQMGRYFKIGGMVTCIGALTFTKGTGTGEFQINGLPFTLANIANMYVAIALEVYLAGAAGEYIQGYVAFNGTVINIDMIPQSTGAGSHIQDTDLAASSTFRFTVSYPV